MNALTDLKKGDTITKIIKKDTISNKSLRKLCLNLAIQRPHFGIRLLQDETNYYIVARKKLQYGGLD